MKNVDFELLNDFRNELLNDFRNELEDNGIEADDSETLEWIKVYLLGKIRRNLADIAESLTIIAENI